jgi:tetratricopeptide (TPR) repeat protein
VSGYQVAHLDEIEEVDDGREPMRAVRHHFGITAFGINAWTAKDAGDRLINEHDETDDQQEEVYLVQVGRARFELDGESLDAPTGTFVFVRPGVKRTAFAEEPGTTLLAVGGVPGKPYEVGGWEIWGPLNRFYVAGDYEAVIEQGRELIEANPQYPLALYNLACCESLSGRSEDAIGHLRQAIDGREQLREYAKEDSDLDAIREEPAFKELVGA